MIAPRPPTETKGQPALPNGFPHPTNPSAPPMEGAVQGTQARRPRPAVPRPADAREGRPLTPPEYRQAWPAADLVIRPVTSSWRAAPRPEVKGHTPRALEPKTLVRHGPPTPQGRQIVCHFPEPPQKFSKTTATRNRSAFQRMSPRTSMTGQVYGPVSFAPRPS